MFEHPPSFHFLRPKRYFFEVAFLIMNKIKINKIKVKLIFSITLPSFRLTIDLRPKYFVAIAFLKGFCEVCPFFCFQGSIMYFYCNFSKIVYNESRTGYGCCNILPRFIFWVEPSIYLIGGSLLCIKSKILKLVLN